MGNANPDTNVVRIKVPPPRRVSITVELKDGTVHEVCKGTVIGGEVFIDGGELAFDIPGAK